MRLGNRYFTAHPHTGTHRLFHSTTQIIPFASHTHDANACTWHGNPAARTYSSLLKYKYHLSLEGPSHSVVTALSLWGFHSSDRTDGKRRKMNLRRWMADSRIFLRTMEICPPQMGPQRSRRHEYCDNVITVPVDRKYAPCSYG